jgi:predicted nucleic acid-binding Zn ribbon protein
VSAAVDHQHCKVCGRVTAPDSETCSRACREVRERRLQTRRNYTLLLYASIALILIVFVSRLLV